MFATITLKFSEAPSQVIVPATGVTILVGPNNSGKSLALRELEALVQSASSPPTLLVGDFELAPYQIDEMIQNMDRLNKPEPSMASEHVRFLRFSPDGQGQSSLHHRSNIEHAVRAADKRQLGQALLQYLLIRLDGRTRFALTNNREQGDLTLPPVNFLARLFQENELRKRVRELVFEALGLYFVIDPTNGGVLRIRMSSKPPSEDEQSLSRDARKFHSEAIYIKDASDGVQAFVGIICAVLSDDFKAILIDEPEAFLHPPLARKLGYQLAKIGIERGGSLIASTHSSDFLLGCLQASSAVRVVRMEYSNGKSRGKLVDSNALTAFFKKPLMRSANVISGLFHDGVVVTESDNDRAFYSEIYYRLAERSSNFPSLLFVNAQNKQTIKDIIGPLRSFGVPAVGISDIDILKDGGVVWTGWLAAANIPAALHSGLAVTRGDLHQRYKESEIDMKKNGGVDALPDAEDKAALNQLFDTLEQYGVFVTRRGELENWLPQLGVTGRKTDWTIAMLDRLGSDPMSSDYVVPGEGDVWEFIEKIVRWIRDPARKGVH